MASEKSSSEDQGEDSHQPRECMACGGSGQVISNLGGTASTVTCPWCAGDGVRVPGIDAHAAWRTEEGEDSALAGDGEAQAQPRPG